MKSLGFLGALLGWLAAACTQQLMIVAATQPHILFVVLDDLGSHDLGMHGTGIQTPHIDQLAKEGVYLDQYYVLPSCSPTRAALLTGRYPLHTGIHDWIGHTSTIGLPLNEQTLPQVLQSVNYTCRSVGKWHLGHSAWPQTPTFRGFDSFFGYYTGSQGYYSHKNDGGYDMRFDKEPYCGHGCSRLVDERGNYSTHVFVREAIKVIESHAEAEAENSPLFLYLAFQAVHDPDEVPSHYIDPYRNRTDWPHMRKTYAGMLSAADEGIHNVTRSLQAHGLWDNTLVVFTTDNGGPTETCAVQGSSNWPKRGGKCSIWEGGTTGDGFLSGPVLSKLNVATKRRVSDLFHCVDWLPTLADMVGAAPAGKRLDGVSQFDFLRGFEPAPRRELFVGYAVNGFTKQWAGPAVRVGNWKLLEVGDGSSPPTPNTTKSYSLFHLGYDPSEANDVALQFPRLVELLKSKLETYKSSLAPIPVDDPMCPGHVTNTSTFGPTWMPWCGDMTQRVVVYE